MMTLNDLRKKWNETSPYSGGYLQISEGHPLSIHVGYENEQRCFIILDTGKIENIDSSKAIDAVCIKLNGEKYGLKFLLKYPSLDELFIKLCWDLLDCSKDVADPLKVVLSRYANWILLLQKQKPGVMSPSRQKGLLAELLFLKEQIQEQDVSIALNAWVGPEGSDQDFVFDNHWCEIKATVKSSHSVSISSLQQLDRSDIGKLIVYFIDKISTNGTGSLSLPQVVQQVMDLIIEQVDKDLFECKLAMYGYYFTDEEHYRNTFYSFSDKKVYSVDSTFPRLTVHNIPPEIIEAKYILDLASIDSFRI